MINNMRDLFEIVTACKDHEVDDADLYMTWDDFHDNVDSVQMQDYFKSLDVDPSDARGIFCLLDQDNVGRVTFEQFVSGCVRLRGQAKSLDMAIMLYELRHMRARIE